MANTVFAVVLLGCVTLVSLQATALQITNRDTVDHTLIVAGLQGDRPQELTAKPSQTIDGICVNGCTITMPDGERYEFDGDETVSIEDGLIFMDGPYDDGETPGMTDAPSGPDEREAVAAN